MSESILNAVLTRGDLAHLALFLWAVGASGVLFFVVREWAKAQAQYSLFVREIAQLNRIFEEGTRKENE